MKGIQIFLFIFVMWGLIVAGGGLLIAITIPITISGYGDLNSLVDSGVKAIIAIILVILWIFLISKIKTWIFKKQIRN